MNLLMIGMQLAEIGLILTAADVFAVPWLQNVLSPSVPTATDADDHVVVCKYTPRGEGLAAELEYRGQEYVIVEPAAERATGLHEKDHRVVHGDSESIETLKNAGVDRAQAVVADAADNFAVIGFPVFARTVTPCGPSGRKEVERNVQVTVGGASADPGDVLIRDEPGVVVIDRDAVEDVTSAAEAVAETERDVDRLIDEGRSLEVAFEDAGM